MPQQFPLQYFNQSAKLQNIAQAETVAEAVQAVAPPPAPANFEVSPEIALAAGAGLAFLLVLYYIITLHRALRQSLKNTEYIKDLYASMYVSDQLKEYIIAFNGLTEAQSEQDRINARTQIFNFLNRISRQICETKDESLALKLSEAFFSKIEGRYVKMMPAPEGVVYFRTVAELLIAHGGRSGGEPLLRMIRREYKSGMAAQSRIVAEPSPKKGFGWHKKEKKS